MEIHDTVPTILRTMVKRASEEKSQGLYEEEAKFLQDLTDCALALASVQDEGRRDWVGQTLAKPFLDVVSKTLNAQKIAGCSRHLHAVLSACALSTHIDLDIAKDVAKRVSKLFHHHRQHCAKISEIYSLMERCCEIIQLGLSQNQVQTIIELVCASIDHKDDWHVRKAGLELLTTLSTVFVDAPKYPGDSEAREVLRKYMGVIQGSLDKARYDKIVHVRKAMQRAQAAFNAVELVSFDDFSVDYDDLKHRQAGAKGANHPRKHPNNRKPFTRPKAKLGNDFGIQIFVPLEDDGEQNEVDLTRAGRKDDNGRSPQQNEHEQEHESAPSPSVSASSPETADKAPTPEDQKIRSSAWDRPSVDAMESEPAIAAGEDPLPGEGERREPKMVSVSDHTLDSLVNIHAQEIERFYREKERDELVKLKSKFENHLKKKKLQEAFERDTAKVKSVIQSAIDKEIDFFRKDRLPKLAKLLSDKSNQAPTSEG